MKKLLLYIITIFLFINLSCTKNQDKEKLIKLYNLSKEFTLSDEFKIYLKEPNEKIRNDLFDKKGNELISKAGFKDIYEVQKVEEKLIDDEDIVRIRDEYEQIREIKTYEARIELEQDSLLRLQSDSIPDK
ncbi:MAG: hypothetical protein N2490_06495 [Ignavibacteria bacterium]|nr:hypothetical protein [Ignavibacteria bacterium]